MNRPSKQRYGELPNRVKWLLEIRNTEKSGKNFNQVHLFAALTYFGLTPDKLVR